MLVIHLNLSLGNSNSITKNTGNKVNAHDQPINDSIQVNVNQVKLISDLFI